MLDGYPMDKDGAWLSIIEFASLRGISISTVRRYIKAERVKTKMEGGKFFIFVPTEKLAGQERRSSAEVLALRLENERLKRKLLELEEERNDLKMLVGLYENGDNNNKDVHKSPELAGPPDISNL